MAIFLSIFLALLGVLLIVGGGWLIGLGGAWYYLLAGLGFVVTAGGVAFHSGTLDYYVRAFDVTDGRELWRDRLPAGGQATPMTYQGADGRQYLVVVAGGHGSTGTKAGDSIIAYALPGG